MPALAPTTTTTTLDTEPTISGVEMERKVQKSWMDIFAERGTRRNFVIVELDTFVAADPVKEEEACEKGWGGVVPK